MVVLYRVPSFLMTSAGSFLWMVPENRRPTPMRPTKLEWSTVQIWSATGPFGSQSGAGTSFRMVSNKGTMFMFSSSGAYRA